MNKLYDFIIVGAGPAGSVLAIELQKIGFNVALIEAHQKMPRKICGEYLCPMGVNLLKDLHLDHLINLEDLKIQGMNIHTANGTHVDTFFPGKNQTKNIGVSVRRDLFDTALINEAFKTNIDLFMGSKISSIKHIGDEWVLKSKDKSFRSRFLIGADGRRSFVAKSLGIRSVAKTDRVAIHAYVNVSATKRQGEMHLFSNGSYIGIDPTAKDELNISLVCNKDELQNVRPIEVLNQHISSSKNLKERIGYLDNGHKVYTITPITNKASSIYGHGFALIGDAAGFLDPLTGEGMYNALWMAKTLAHEIKVHAQYEMFNFDKAFKKYAQKKKLFFLQKNALNHVFQFIIRSPFLCSIIAKYLSKNQQRKDTFVGIIGNIYSPLEGIFKLLRS